jgi:hypothetical protein
MIDPHRKSANEGAPNVLGAPPPANQVSQGVIAGLLVSNALNDKQPLDKLTALYLSERFSTIDDKVVVITALRDAEHQAIGDLRDFEDVSAELRGALAHSGELFELLLNSVAKEYPQGPILPVARLCQLGGVSRAWSEVLLEELTYVSRSKEWLDAELALLQHACDILGSLPYFWDKRFSCSLPSDIRKNVVATLSSVLQQPNFVALLKGSESPDVTKAILRVFHLVGLLGEPQLADLVVSHTPTVYEKCCVLAPEDFLLKQGDKQEAEDWSADDHRSFLEDLSDLEYGETVFQEAQESFQAEVVTDWCELLRNCLRAAHLPGRFAFYATDFRSILVNSPFKMDCYQEALDALVYSSEDQLRCFLSDLVARCLEDRKGLVFQVSLAEFYNR